MGTPPAAFAEDGAETYELSREALAAALPDISAVTADLVGWAGMRPAVEHRQEQVTGAANALAGEGHDGTPERRYERHASGAERKGDPAIERDRVQLVDQPGA